MIIINKKKALYLPKVRTYYQPTNEEYQIYTGVGIDINIPNPVEDDIVVNNIAYQEFDYTEDMMPEEDLFE